MPGWPELESARHIGAVSVVASLFGKPRETGGLIGSLGVKAEPSLYPEAKFVLYQVLIRNASSQPLLNARIVPEVVDGNVRVRDSPKIMPKLSANSSGTATFALEPTDEVDTLQVDGFMTFSRERHNSRLQLSLPRVSFDFSMPSLMHLRTTQEQWKEKVSKYFSDEEIFVAHNNAGNTLAMASGILQDLGLAYVTRFKAEDGFVAERRDFFAVDKRGRGYAARVLWRYLPSKDAHPTLLVRVFSETEEGLFAFCHRVSRRFGRALVASPPESVAPVSSSDQCML